MAKIGKIDLGNYPIILAPMEDITDPPFRILCKEQGADLLYTEFASAEALVRDISKTKMKLDFSEQERPVGIQIFGNEAGVMAEAAALINSLEQKPDFIDINWGCPMAKIINSGAGSGILRDVPKMTEITDAVVKASKLPVTVKTRIGWSEDSINIGFVAEALQDVGIQAIAVHGRTRCQMYKGLADWKPIAELKNNPRLTIPVFGNGDVKSPELAKSMRDDYGLDGCMIGRATVGNPWIFAQVKHFLKTGEYLHLPELAERAAMAKRHLQAAMQWKGEQLGLLETRKHYAKYFRGMDNFKEQRVKLCTSQDKDEVLDVLNRAAGLI